MKFMKTISVGVHEAKTRLSDLLRLVERGVAVVVITRHGQPVAELQPPRPAEQRQLGAFSEGWNLPGVDELERLFLEPDEDLEKEFYGANYKELLEIGVVGEPGIDEEEGGKEE